MIALIAGDEWLRRGPIPIGLAYAGFEIAEVDDASAAAEVVGRHGAEDCLLVLGEDTYCRALGSEDSPTTGGEASDTIEAQAEGPWDALLAAHERLALVVVAPGCAQEISRRITCRPHRMLLVDPFDAAAVVEGAIRASATARRRAQRVPPRGRLADAKYAS